MTSQGERKESYRKKGQWSESIKYLHGNSASDPVPDQHG
jgi:hypothetical protein